MNRLDSDICHIEPGGFYFGKAAEHLRTADRAIIVPSGSMIKIKMDNRGSSPARKRNKYGGFVVGVGDNAKSTGRIGRYFRFKVADGWICIDLTEEAKR